MVRHEKDKVSKPKSVCGHVIFKDQYIFEDDAGKNLSHVDLDNVGIAVCIHLC